MAQGLPAALVARSGEPRDYTKLVADWALQQLAALDDRRDLVRWYDKRYHRAELTREDAIEEAALAAKLAREYTTRPDGEPRR